MTPVEKSALLVVRKIQNYINEAIAKLPVGEITTHLKSMADSETRWLEALTTDAPLPEIMPEGTTSRLVFERLALYANYVNSDAFKAMGKAGENTDAATKFKWIFELSNYQFKWLDALRYNLPLPEDSIDANKLP